MESKPVARNTKGTVVATASSDCQPHPPLSSPRSEESSRGRRSTPPPRGLIQSLRSSPGNGRKSPRQLSIARWEAHLRTWPQSCSNGAELKARRIWRRKALDLVSEHGGVPKEIRRRVWQAVLEAAVEQPSSSSEEEAAGREKNNRTATSVVRTLPPRTAEDDEVAELTDGRCQTREATTSLRVVPTSSSSSSGSKEANVPRWARPRRNDDGRVSPRRLPREIALDVPRTFGGRDLVDEAAAFHSLSADDEPATSSHQYIEQTRLRRLLVHFARTTPGVQYYQGMNFLGGTLLRVFDDSALHQNDSIVAEHASYDRSSMSGGKKTVSPRAAGLPPRSTTIDAATATAFRGLMALVTSLYVPDFSGLRELVAVAGALLPRFAPKLASVLEAEGLDLMPITAAWCLTFFSSSAMDFECVLCCWDFLIIGTPSRREELMLPDEDEDESDVHESSPSDKKSVGGGGGPRLFLPSGLLSRNGTSSKKSPSAASQDEEQPGADSPSGATCYTPSVHSSESQQKSGVARPARFFSSSSSRRSREDGFVATSEKLPRSRSQRRRDKALKNQSTTAERHAMLLRLNLVMLRLGERATWGAREESGAQVDDLQSLSELLEAAQPSPVVDPEVSPGANSALARKRSGCCFPSSTEVLCSLVAKTRVETKTLRACAKRYRKSQESPTAPTGALQPPRSTTVRPADPPPPEEDLRRGLFYSFFASLARRLTRWRSSRAAAIGPP